MTEPIDRYRLHPGQNTMWAVVTTGNGGYDRLRFCEVPKPIAEPGYVVIRVTAAGVNNTEINTRLGWYSETVSDGTEGFSDHQELKAEQKSDGGWNAETPFPFIQGTDCCGIVESTWEGEDKELLGKRVLVRACMRANGFESMENVWMASDFDGAFAQYVKVPTTEVFAVDCDWTDAELATIPCAYSTAENMLHRCAVGANDTVLIPGASGGVGSAALQLAKRRGARVIAICGKSKISAVSALGADLALERNTNVLAELGEESVDVVVDNVAGPHFGNWLKLLRRGGRYTSSGAIAGPVVNLDMRQFYLKDILMVGCTAWDEPVFPNLIRYIEAGEIKPVLASTYPLEDIAKAQQHFLKKQHVGNFVLIPPPDAPAGIQE
ncbi:MAG: alcohol dehydrogenase family protein [Pseudomonadota bacterium]